MFTWMILDFSSTLAETPASVAVSLQYMNLYFGSGTVPLQWPIQFQVCCCNLVFPETSTVSYGLP